jgi:hypothetical protein
MELLGDKAQVEAHFGPFGDSAYLTRCMVCAERIVGSEIILDAPDGTPRFVGHVESRFGLFEGSVSVCAI